MTEGEGASQEPSPIAIRNRPASHTLRTKNPMPRDAP